MSVLLRMQSIRCHHQLFYTYCLNLRVDSLRRSSLFAFISKSVNEISFSGMFQIAFLRECSAFLLVCVNDPGAVERAIHVTLYFYLLEVRLPFGN